MNKSNRFAPEVRERAVRMVQDHRTEYSSQWAAIESIAPKIWQANMQVYGADKVWRQLNREEVPVARCTVERLMKRLGLEGARRSKVVRTTVPDKALPCPLDRVNRQFKDDRHN